MSSARNEAAPLVVQPQGTVNARNEPFETLLGTCGPDGAAAFVEVLIGSALAAWRTNPRDTRGSLKMLGEAVALIARRDDL